ncbi:acyl carrier protein [Paenibacillus phyllosphaerae]|uniref:Acyl carrier protein n=1 Tax=Paenibacillus phyllosphaerae TaxID=274593 RepID=A0A7W5B504_9BACL|nr:phosphopantetheine-binding protein [Paenibacillus phyllosphaerae]MBB3114046.1 acyl carrier protein [Paenibacillus phyllosphaerae]
MNIEQTIKETVVAATDGAVDLEKVESVGDNLGSLGLSSLVQVRLIVLLEEKFDIEVDVEMIEEMQLLNSLSSMVKYVSDELKLGVAD